MRRTVVLAAAAVLAVACHASPIGPETIRYVNPFGNLNPPGHLIAVQSFVGSCSAASFTSNARFFIR